MEALAVTIFLSLLLAGGFVILFLGSQKGTRNSLEQEALLPLDPPQCPGNPQPKVKSPHHDTP
ncbi:hypothetical protein FEM03_10900 [Phragmitibacter flavus]|uniref:Uncharacterized protein n=1 Tax=Phragmitibacter flavus TaxID=2576071 RepID=A0A5R8KGT1_9BACT|nr:hypothetical protein [Phragmitibacter flavus]TLD70809.1 hypothetical protein FEM03_10900 [Phragmitibacter flavus]